MMQAPAHPLLKAANYDPRSKKNRLASNFAPNSPLSKPTSTLATEQDAALLDLLPDLAANISHSVESELPGTEVMLGGGTALTLKHTATGRLGPASRNMRDLDFDLEVANGKAFDAGTATTPKQYLESHTKTVTDALATVLPPGSRLFRPASVTGNNTLMCNYFGHLEISFHMESLAAPGKPGSEERSTVTGKTYRLLNDASHLAMSLNALQARLGRPDKLWKNLQDPLVLAASQPEQDEQDKTVAKVGQILAAPAADSAVSRKVLAGYNQLAGDGTIRGIEPIKTADGRELQPARMFGYTNKKQESIAQMNLYWNPARHYWRLKNDVRPVTEQAHFHQDFKDSYAAIINTVLDDLTQTAGREGRTAKHDWPRFLTKLKF